MRRLLVLPLLALMGVFLVVPPASAAPITTFTVDGGTSASIEAGESVTFAWTAEDGTVTLSSTPPVDDFDEVGADGSGTRDVTLETPGTYTFTVTSDDVEDPDSSTVTVEVAPAAADTIVVPAPIAFPDPCTVVFPEQEGVEYGVGFGGYGDGVDAGEYDITEFYNYGEAVIFFTSPAEGFAFPEGTDTQVEVTPSQDCFPQIVEFDPACGSIEFTNTIDETVVVQYGDLFADEPDGELELEAGASRTVRTDRDLVFFIAGSDPEADFEQAGFIAVEQDCSPSGAGADHPTVAPAAGA